MEIHHASEQEVGDGQRGEHGHDNTDAQRGSEADDRAGAKEEQHAARDQGGDVGVQNCGECTLEAGVNGALDGLAGSHFLLDALEDDDVCVNRHTDGQDDTCDTGQGQGHVKAVQQKYYQCHINAQCNNRSKSGQEINCNHENSHYDKSDHSCF